MCFMAFGQENSRDRRFGVVLFRFGQENSRDRRVGVFYLGLDRRTGGTRRVYGAIVRVASLGVPNRHAL